MGNPPVEDKSLPLKWNDESYGYGSIPINTIFRGMNIHLPAILMFTRGTRFWHTAIWWQTTMVCKSARYLHAAVEIDSCHGFLITSVPPISNRLPGTQFKHNAFHRPKKTWPLEGRYSWRSGTPKPCPADICRTFKISLHTHVTYIHYLHTLEKRKTHIHIRINISITIISYTFIDTHTHTHMYIYIHIFICSNVGKTMP